jgi:hypothetical protein
MWTVTCQYKPTGNVGGQYLEMVGNQASGSPYRGIANVANKTMTIPSDSVVSNGYVGILGLAVGLMVAIAPQAVGLF